MSIQNRKIIQISRGPFATMALCNDGTVWEWAFEQDVEAIYSWRPVAGIPQDEVPGQTNAMKVAIETLEELQVAGAPMTGYEIGVRMLVAERDEWHPQGESHDDFWNNPNTTKLLCKNPSLMPDYTRDRNAIIEAILRKGPGFTFCFDKELKHYVDIRRPKGKSIMTVTPLELSEIYLESIRNQGKVAEPEKCNDETARRKTLETLRDLYWNIREDISFDALTHHSQTILAEASDILHYAGLMDDGIWKEENRLMGFEEPEPVTDLKTPVEPASDIDTPEPGDQ